MRLGDHIVPIAATYQRLREKHMIAEAEEKGAQLEGQVAIQLANNATYLREIAKKALEVGNND